MRELYTSQFKAANIDHILESAVRHEKLSMNAYERLVETGKIDPQVWYCIYTDAQLTDLDRIYVGDTLLIVVADKMTGIMKEEKMTMEQYLQLRQERKIVPGTWYSIFTDYAHKNLVAVYNGNKLILKGDDGEAAGFPYTFPKTF